MGSRDPNLNWSDPDLLSAIGKAFDATWPILRAHEPCPGNGRIAELSMMLSHKLVELAAGGIRDPQQMRKLALESFALA
jgi:hypothetical protein